MLCEPSGLQPHPPPLPARLRMISTARQRTSHARVDQYHRRAVD
jgi:hypothetical protein